MTRKLFREQPYLKRKNIGGGKERIEIVLKEG